MLQIASMTLGAYQTNTYLVWEDASDSCVVIDPGYEPARISAELKKLHKTLAAILLTHGHFDHVGGVRELAAQWDCPVYLHEAELSMPEKLTAGRLSYTNLYNEGDTLSLAGTEFTVLHTPGHTPGSVCLVCQDALFSGDTLFAGSCGRTDLPGGSWGAIRASLERLSQLEEDYSVFPGHGAPSRLSHEKRYNPYLRGNV